MRPAGASPEEPAAAAARGARTSALPDDPPSAAMPSGVAGHATLRDTVRRDIVAGLRSCARTFCESARVTVPAHGVTLVLIVAAMAVLRRMRS